MADEGFMQVAIDLAGKAKQRADLPFGAVIVHQGVIVGEGSSHEHTLDDVTKHAETTAVSEASKKLGRKLRDCTLYATAEPCTMCASAIFQAEIPRIVIGVSRDDQPGIFRKRKLRFQDLVDDAKYQPEVEFGFMRDRIMELFTEQSVG